MRTLTISFLVFTTISLIGCKDSQKTEIRGELKKWHKISLVFEGPESSELAESNPFLNYRLDVTFTNGNHFNGFT